MSQLAEIQPLIEREKITLSKCTVPAFCILLASGLLIFPQEAMMAARKGAVVWYTNVMPALLPFLFVTGILSKYMNVSAKGVANTLMKLLFKVNGNGLVVLLSGLIGGFPSGAVLTCAMLEKKLIQKDEAERLLGFANICSPMFVAGTLATGLLLIPEAALAMAISNALSGILAGILLGILYGAGNKYRKLTIIKNDIKTQAFSDIIVTSAKTAMMAVLTAGCFIIIFSVASEMLHISLIGLNGIRGNEGGILSNNIINGIITIFIGITKGILEICNGCFALSDSLKTALIAGDKLLFVLNMAAVGLVAGFSGFAVHLQVMSVTSGKGLKMNQYFTGKIIQGFLLCIMYTVIGIIYFNSSR